MQKINAEIHWSEKNYCCGWGAEGIGTIMCTDKTLDGVKKAFKESLEFHIEGMVSDGDNVPQWLIDKEYEINYILDVSALLRSIEPYTTMAAISRATGINQKQLSHYASSVKTPRPIQRQKIIEGIHKIGEVFMAIR